MPFQLLLAIKYVNFINTIMFIKLTINLAEIDGIMRLGLSL